MSDADTLRELLAADGWVPGSVAMNALSRLEARAAQADLAVEHAMTQERLRAEFAVEADRLREALGRVKMGCLLDVRAAAFGPEIGVRYTETIRAGIAGACARLEQFIDASLAPTTGDRNSGHP